MRAGKVPPTDNVFWKLFVRGQCAFCPSKMHFTSKQLIEQQSGLWTHQVSYWAKLSGSIKLQTYNAWLVLWDKRKVIQTFLCFENSLVTLLLSLAPSLPSFLSSSSSLCTPPRLHARYKRQQFHLRTNANLGQQKRIYTCFPITSLYVGTTCLMTTSIYTHGICIINTIRSAMFYTQLATTIVHM